MVRLEDRLVKVICVFTGAAFATIVGYGVGHAMGLDSAMDFYRTEIIPEYKKVIENYRTEIIPEYEKFTESYRTEIIPRYKKIIEKDKEVINQYQERFGDL